MGARNQTFRVRLEFQTPEGRQKVVGTRTRGVGGITYGDLDFGPVRVAAFVHP